MDREDRLNRRTSLLISYIASARGVKLEPDKIIPPIREQHKRSQEDECLDPDQQVAILSQLYGSPVDPSTLR